MASCAESLGDSPSSCSSTVTNQQFGAGNQKTWMTQRKLSRKKAKGTMMMMKEEEHPTQENVCVEVSVDSQNRIVSIMVEEENRVLSVVAVPQNPTKASKNDILSGKMASLVSTPASSSKPSRRADALRPTSPIKSRRSSAFYECGTPHRRISMSCPPPTNRRETSRSSSAERRHCRDASCPPKLLLLSSPASEQSKDSNGVEQHPLREPMLASNKSLKPNLVAAIMKTKKKRGIFPNLKTTRGDNMYELSI